MNELEFVKSLTDALDAESYSLGKMLSYNPHNRYFIPDAIIYQNGKPLVIVEFKKSYPNERLRDRAFSKLAEIQDYADIPWIICTTDGNLYLRPLNGDFENYGDIKETARIIRMNDADTVPPLTREDYLSEIKHLAEIFMPKLAQKKQATHILEQSDNRRYYSHKTRHQFLGEKRKRLFHVAIVTRKR